VSRPEPIVDDPPCSDLGKIAVHAAADHSAAEISPEFAAPVVARGPAMNDRSEPLDRARAPAAGVSPRTYNNYFSSREQAIVVALAAERGHAVAAALRERPADEPLEHAVVGALIEQYSDGGEPDRDTLALITSTPALQAEFLDTIAAIERPLADAIAARTGAADQGELGPEVLAAAVSGATRVAAERWLQPEPDVRFSDMLNEALTWIVPALRAADQSPQPDPKVPP
jgi:AcrR family transcriptional regulator